MTGPFRLDDGTAGFCLYTRDAPTGTSRVLLGCGTFTGAEACARGDCDGDGIPNTIDRCVCRPDVPGPDYDCDDDGVSEPCEIPVTVASGATSCALPGDCVALGTMARCPLATDRSTAPYCRCSSCAMAYVRLGAGASCALDAGVPDATVRPDASAWDASSVDAARTQDAELYPEDASSADGGTTADGVVAPPFVSIRGGACRCRAAVGAASGRGVRHGNAFVWAAIVAAAGRSSRRRLR